MESSPIQMGAFLLAIVRQIVYKSFDSNSDWVPAEPVNKRELYLSNAVKMNLKTSLAVKPVWLAILTAVLFLPGWLAVAAQPEPQPPSIDTLITNVLDRLAWAQKQGFRGQYSYVRIRAIEQLDGDGKANDRDEKQYEVFPIAGRPYSKWVALNGKPLSEKERQSETEREQTTRAKLAGVKTSPVPKKEVPITAELLSRYDFKFLGSTQFNGRLTWVLSFAPKPGDLPEAKMQDRVANKMAGTAWIDAQEYEVVKADLHLTANVKLVGGVVGLMRKFDYILERSRVGDGIWFTTRSEANIEGRELVLNKRVRVRDEARDFKKIRAG
jgi:hypothetical protein